MTYDRSYWQNLIEVQQIYPKAEAVNNFTVFNIKGNRYRLITDIQYSKQLIYVKYILTHEALPNILALKLLQVLRAIRTWVPSTD